MYGTTNIVHLDDINNTNINGKYQIDPIAVSCRFLNHIEEHQLLNNNKIVYLDNRAYLVGVNLEEYFDDQFSS